MVLNTGSRPLPTPSSEITELEDLDVREVSLVDAPAIRRKFLIIKREDAKMSDNTDAIEHIEADTVIDTDPAAPEIELAKEEQEIQAQPEVEVVKDDATVEAVKADEEVVEEATVEAEQVNKEADDVAVDEVEKAKRMTKSRLERMYKLHAELGSLLKELAPLQGGDAKPQGDSDGKVNTPAVASYKPAPIAKEEIEAIAKEAAEAAATSIIGKMKEEAQPTPAEAIEKAEAPKEEAADAKDQEVADLRKQLSTLEATPNAGISNTTDTVQKNSQPFWSGIL